MNCPKCNHAILNEGTNFCPKCGFHLSEVQKRCCPQCSAEITEEGTNFCPVCGVRLTAPASASPVAPCPAPVIHQEPAIATQATGTNSKTIVRALGIALILIAIGLGIVAIVIPSTMDGWDYHYGGGRETTTAVAVSGGVAFILGICLAIASAKVNGTVVTTSVVENHSASPTPVAPATADQPASPAPVPPAVDQEKLQQLNTLLMQHLITEEEYQQALSKNR